MDNAIIILAHGDIDNLLALIGYFDSQCDIFVHIDKKFHVKDDTIKDIRRQTHVKGVYNHISVHWGGNSILDCELFMLREAARLSDATYFHIVSGEDYPIKPLEYFLGFFKKGHPANYISCVHLPHPLWQDNTYSRFQYFYPYDWGGKERHPGVVSKAIRCQQRLGIKRRLPDMLPHLYGGSQWMSITRDAVNVLMRYTKEKPALYRRMFMVFAPDEIYIQTVLSNLLDKRLLVNTNKRFIRWKMENGSFPAVLSVGHFFHLASSDKLIARKMQAGTSDRLKAIVQKYLWNDSICTYMKNGGWNYDGYLRYSFDIGLATKLHSYIKAGGFVDGVDFGCGCGFYVAYLRRCGFPMMGYDANPYTPQLSKLILPSSDIPCEVADISGKIDGDVQYDIVLCLDVLTYIPKQRFSESMGNLLKICNRSLVVSLNSEYMSVSECNDMLSQATLNGFHFSHALSVMFKDNDKPAMEYFIFERQQA